MLLATLIRGANRALREVQQGRLQRADSTFTTAACLRGLGELVPRLLKEGEQAPVIGRAWQAKDLRSKSWDDLHKLWYVLLKERNKLHSEKLAYRAAKQRMSDPGRLTKVRKGMSRIKAVMSERLAEHEDAETRAQLKAFIDAL